MLFLFLPISSFAAGPFDGIYSINLDNNLVGYISVHENDSNMIAIMLETDPFDSTWEAISGIRNNNNANFTSIAGTIALDISVVFNDRQ